MSMRSTEEKKGEEKGKGGGMEKEENNIEPCLAKENGKKAVLVTAMYAWVEDDAGQRRLSRTPVDGGDRLLVD
ncbi:hypothetical protein Tco_0093693 [Tanacetum coccineum]